MGQGFPNWFPPDFVLNFAKESIEDKSKGASIHHYARVNGHGPLVEQLVQTYSPLLKQDLRTENVIVTDGASEALYTAIQAFVDPGDEVITFEPYFDLYEGAVIMSGGVIKPVPLYLEESKKNKDDLTSGDLVFDVEKLKSAFSDKTKVLLLNTPHNPTGKVFSKEELETIASIVKDHPRCIILSDEVYEWMVYDDAEHIRIATFDGMWERTLTISSAAKTFSVTGWKVGWAIGPQELVSALMRAHAYIVFCVNTPFQDALSKAFKHAREVNYFNTLREEYQKRRDFIIKALKEAGLKPIKPQGTFFTIADISKISLKDSEGTETITGVNMGIKDWRVSRWLTTDIGVTSIPCSVFYSEENRYDDFIRFAFCKTDDILQEASERLKKLKDYNK